LVIISTPIILKRGKESKRKNITPKRGEPIVSFDDVNMPRFFIGNGNIEGGIEIGASESISSIPATISSFDGYKIKRFRIRVSANDLNNNAQLGQLLITKKDGTVLNNASFFTLAQGNNSSYSINLDHPNPAFAYEQHAPWDLATIPTNSSYDGTFAEFIVAFEDGEAHELNRVVFASSSYHTGKYHMMSLEVQIESEAGDNDDGSDGIWRYLFNETSMQYNSDYTVDTSHKHLFIKKDVVPETIVDFGNRKVKRARFRISGSTLNNIDLKDVYVSKLLFYDENDNPTNYTDITWSIGEFNLHGFDAELMQSPNNMFHNSLLWTYVGYTLFLSDDVFLELIISFNSPRQVHKIEIGLPDKNLNYEMFLIDVQFEESAGINSNGSDGTWYRAVTPRSISSTVDTPGLYTQYILNDVYSLLENKENILNNPSEDGMMLTSTALGIRSWKVPSNIHFYNPSIYTDVITPSPYAHFVADNLASGQLSQWNDISGNNRHFIQNTSNKQPIVVSNALNGYPVVRFDGIDDEMRSSIHLGSRYAVIVVAKINALEDYNGIVSNLTDVSDNLEFGMFFQLSGQLRTGHRIAGVNYWTGASPITTDSYHILSSRFNGAGILLRDAGNTLAFLTTSVAPVSTTVDMVLAKYHNVDIWTSMDIAEIIMYNADLEDNDFMKIEGYLAWKYGEQNILASGHLYQGNPPMVIV